MRSIALRYETFAELRALAKGIGATLDDTVNALLGLARELGQDKEGHLVNKIASIKRERAMKKARKELPSDDPMMQALEGTAEECIE